MHLSTPVRRGLVAVATAATALTVMAAPADASDLTMELRSPSGDLRLRATYDDLTDNLCVRVWGPAGADGRVVIAPDDPADYPRPDIEQGAKAGERRCTGNLSIREDRPWQMAVQWRNLPSVVQNSGVRRFYT
jgi:hypothetical protein